MKDPLDNEQTVDMFSFNGVKNGTKRTCTCEPNKQPLECQKCGRGMNKNKLQVTYDINTAICGSEIQQTITSRDEYTTELISRGVIDTADEQIREALIKLGWTPPSMGRR